MTDIVAELRRGAEMEEEYDADGIVRIGYRRSLRYRAADEIERLREAVKFLNSFRPDAELAKRDAEIELLRQQVTQRGARMQVMRNYLTRYSGPSTTLWRDFCRVRPEAAGWFDEEGVPR